MSVNQWEDPNPEQRWFECSIDQLAELRAQALELGESTATVNGLIGWIVGGEPKASSAPTRAVYRAILRTVGPPTEPKGRRGGRLRSVGQRGFTRVGVLAAGTAASGALVLAPVSPLLAAVGAVAAPIILDTREAAATPQMATQRLSRVRAQLAALPVAS